jgi:predicted transcriptional regulator
LSENYIIIFDVCVVVISLKKRANLGIISLILEASSTGAYEAKKTTVIMYNTLLNHPLLKEYWTALTEEGLLVYDSATQTFKTTEKGLKFLESIAK